MQLDKGIIRINSDELPFRLSIQMDCKSDCIRQSRRSRLVKCQLQEPGVDSYLSIFYTSLCNFGTVKGKTHSDPEEFVN